MKSSGFYLVLLGLVGVAFFWVTDPRWGWTGLWGDAGSLIDRANEAMIGTIVGFIGCAAMVVTGVWLMFKRAT